MAVRGIYLSTPWEKYFTHPNPESERPVDHLTIYLQEMVMKSTRFWLVVEPTHLKNISQNGNLPQIGRKIKKYLKPPPRFFCCQNSFPSKWVHGHSFAETLRWVKFRENKTLVFKVWNGYRMDFFWKFFQSRFWKENHHLHSFNFPNMEIHHWGFPERKKKIKLRVCSVCSNCVKKCVVSLSRKTGSTPLESRKKTCLITFHYTGWFIGILTMAYYNPHKTGVVFHPLYNLNQPGALFFVAHL